MENEEVMMQKRIREHDKFVKSIESMDGFRRFGANRESGEAKECTRCGKCKNKKKNEIMYKVIDMNDEKFSIIKKSLSKKSFNEIDCIVEHALKEVLDKALEDIESYTLQKAREQKQKERCHPELYKYNRNINRR